MTDYKRVEYFMDAITKFSLFYTIKSQLVRPLLRAAAIFSSHSIFVKVAFVKLEKRHPIKSPSPP